MVINRGEMKRKRRDECPSPLLDESPKRTKVHAQRKFAQGSNVNSPVITPVKEIEKQEIDIMPEPVELLPIKRPNTEDFLTFLCFRGTPILPPSLNFFNTASIVDTNGQVHEIKSESPKNGPIDTSAIAKSGSGSSERPFIAFGVRKRADPIVISRQMDKKRRHALALQALRRKYQEQRMAKIRAVTISKLSEKVTSKTLVRSNSITKTETITKKTALAKAKTVEVVRDDKMTTRSVKAGLRPQIKQKMCLRSFRGRFVQKELQFRNVKKRPPPPVKKLKAAGLAGTSVKKVEEKKSDGSDYSSDDEKPLKTSEVRRLPKVVVPKIAKKSAPGPKKPMEINFRITRSNKFLSTKIVSRRQQIKQRMLLTTPKTIIKPRTLRSQTAQKARILPDTKPKILPKSKKEPEPPAKETKKREPTPPVKKVTRSTDSPKPEPKESAKKDEPNGKKEPKTADNPKKIVNKPVDALKKAASPPPIKTKPEKPPVPKKEPEPVKKAKVVVKQTPESVKVETKKEVLAKKKPTVILRKAVPKPAEKKETVKKVEDVDKKAEVVKVEKESVELRTSQRPTRKTKEAAAIYMEILSHKLVNEGKADDDNVSIDSFPELPNVKKTEQRENELKAKAKTAKTSESESGETKKPTKPPKEKDKEKESDAVESKVLRSSDKKKVPQKAEEKKTAKIENPKKETVEEEKDVKKSVKEELCERKTRSANVDKNPDKVPSPVEKIKEVELKVHINAIDVETESKKLKVEKTECKEPPAKKKCPETNDSEVPSDLKKKKSNDKDKDKVEVESTKRVTRNSSQNIRHTESDDSDESFHADIRIPRKKQLTRSKVKCESENEDSQKSKTSVRTNAKTYKEYSSSESDQSTTSDVNVKPVKPSKNKKFTKTRGQQKDDQGFSDSDEEPLSKLTLNKNPLKETKEKEAPKEVSSNEKKKLDPDTKDKEKPPKHEEKEVFVKPKRECAKRPQNYLPMFSSSDEDESYFHGFQLKSDPKPRNAKTESCSHLPTTSDLSCKDIGRRFGKGKVNMSTEQIEKWLKDSAMAGNSVKNENDAMLKFGEKIPTETSHSVAGSIDTEKLKTLLITTADKPETKETKKEALKVEKDKDSDKQIPLKMPTPPTDRKLIFRHKDKSGAINVNAFSASNENSVYAFGEETEDVMKTPFRRPVRRPSSTATSKSEDEKFEEVAKPAQFRKPPLMKQDSNKSKESESEEKPQSSNEETTFYPPQPAPKLVVSQKIDKKPLPPASKCKQRLDVSDDPKYKVPSSPSASSSSSAKLYKRQTSKFRATEVLPVKLPDFPLGGCGQLVEAPTFHPNEKEFQDPIEYIEKIRPKAEQFGICRIIPPSTFKPECKVTDDMRFTAYNQYVHKMLHRWGPNFKELMAIKKYLSTQNISLTHPPWIGGMEIDLPRLYQTVQSLGGLKEVIEKKKWPKVSDAMKIPKSAQDRVTKLDDIYCKYLLPYDTLSPAEREKLFDEVETDWAKRESKSLLKAQQNVDENSTEMESESDDEAEECIVKGRSMALNAFYRIARNTMSMWFKNPEPLAEEVELEFWKHVTLKQNHICVHSGSIDSGNWGYGFAVSKNSPFARHSWNLKVLTNNSGSVLRAMGPVMGVTVPTLHVGMVFSSCCWYRDPHSLPWIEYLHTGGNKIWYGVPNSTGTAFHAALKSLVPNYCRNKSLWLPSDTVMVPPNLLIDNGVSLCRIVQEPGQFIVVFPKVFTSSLSTGYVVSESVYFAPPYWLKTGRTVFDELRNSCEPSMFSFDRLLLSIVNDARSNVEVLRQIIPAVQELCDKEKAARDKIKSLGVSATEKLPLPETPQVRKKKKLHSDDGEYECEVCNANLFVSMVSESQDDVVYCLDHAAEQIEKKKIQSKHCKLMYTYDDADLDGLVERIRAAITNKMQKKIPNKFAGMPTLLAKQ
ncbi:protein Jumonji [Zophobas morio]|uniref:protein Jumonji n=1 Tax=Zophobas morio TaxID=2755281 RepID=UPI0030839E8B